MTMVKPNFLIVGAAKAGTTALYYYLKQHKDIGYPDLKEPKYFSSCNLKFPHNGVGDISVDKYAVKDWEEYLNLFKDLGSHRRIGEISPDYLFYHKHTAPLVKDKLGDIPIIIILRNPVKRAFSAYSYLKRDNREVLSFREALDKEEERRSQNWDFIWSYKEGGCYHKQVETYKKIFTNVKVVFFEDMINSPLEFINNLLEFLGLSQLDNFIYEKHNASGLPNNYLAKLILSRNNNFSIILREFIKTVIPRSILENVSQKSLRKIHINKEDEEFLIEYYKDDVIGLERLLNRELNSWKK